VTAKLAIRSIDALSEVPQAALQREALEKGTS